MRRRLMLAASLVAAFSMVIAGTAIADNGKGNGGESGKGKSKSTTTINIDVAGVHPEGIAAKGGWVYTGSSQTGAIYRAPRRGTTAEQLSAGGTDGRTAAIGMKFDKNGHLVVAGGGTGTVFVVDRSNGATLGKFTRPPAGAYDATTNTFLNDVTIAKNGDAYITDSFSAVIYRIPAAALAAPTMTGELEEWLLLAGSPIVYQGGFNLNGIVAHKNKYLVVVQANTGKLYRIKISNKMVTEIALNGVDLTGGDGMLLVDGRKLWVVNSGAIDVVKLNSKFTSVKRLRKTVTDATFDSPTTIALHKGRLYVVNSQFGKLFGPGDPAAPFTISVLKANQGKH